MIQSCIRASIGEILCFGSQSRHLSIKSMKLGLEQRSKLAKLLLPGILTLPLEFSTKIGSLLSSKKIFFLVDWLRT